VARGIGGGCDEEALDVVEDAEFVPAKVDGKPVPARTTVWIQFSLSQR
jgi:protein TonB